MRNRLLNENEAITLFVVLHIVKKTIGVTRFRKFLKEFSKKIGLSESTLYRVMAKKHSYADIPISTENINVVATIEDNASKELAKIIYEILPELKPVPVSRTTNSDNSDSRVKYQIIEKVKKEKKVLKETYSLVEAKTFLKDLIFDKIINDIKIKTKKIQKKNGEILLKAKINKINNRKYMIKKIYL